jgi:hypothetical protein
MRNFGGSSCEKFKVNRICNCLKFEVLIAVMFKDPSLLHCNVVSLGGRLPTTVQDLNCVFHEYGDTETAENSHPMTEVAPWNSAVF